MFTRVFKPSQRSFFLLGPRGTGKTTWLKSHYKSAVFYDLLDFSTYLRLLKNPSVFRQEIFALKKNQVIVIDEVQRLPRVLDDVHHFLSQINNKRQFILSGSSARKLKRHSANLLAGRASQKFFYPLVSSEYRDFFKAEDILKYGTLPEVMNLKKTKDKIEFLESYVGTYLREEIQQEAIVKNIDGFSRFLDVSSICNGQITNLSSLSRDSGVSRITLKKYFQILEDTLIGSWLRAWRPRARIKEVQSPKFFLFDTGVVRTLSNRIRKELSDSEKGFILETYILHELKVWNQIHDWGSRICFWKTHNNVEIDFILEIEDQRVGIEVKASSVWKREFGKHLKVAREERFVNRSFGIYLGERKLHDNGMEVYPFFEFLELFKKNRLLS